AATRTDRALVAGAFNSAVVVYTRCVVAHRFAGRFPARYYTGNHIAVDGLDVPHTNHLPGIDRSRSFSRVHELQPIHSPRAQLSSHLSGGSSARLEWTRLLFRLRPRDFYLRLLVVRPNAQEFRRRGLATKRHKKHKSKNSLG